MRRLSGYETVYGTATTITTTLAPGSHLLRVEVPPYYGLITLPAAPVAVQVNVASGGQLNPGPLFEGQSPGAMTAGDFNGDGLIDLAIANTAAHTISFFTGTNTGVPGGPVTIPLSFAPGGVAPLPNAVLVTDPADNAVAQIQYSTSYIYPPLGASILVGTQPVAIAGADFNNDGFADFVTANAGSNDVSLVLSTSNGGGLLPAVSLPAGEHPDAILVADFNNDGNADIAVANRDDNNIMVFTGNGDGTFSPPVTVTGLSGPVAMSAADLNGDGKTDLAVGGRSGQVNILLGNGDGTFNTFATYQAGSGLTGIAATYFGAGASPSLAVTTSAGLLVFSGNGDGTFKTPAAYPQYADAASMAVGSFDADHKMEIAVSLPSTNSVAFVYNDVSTSAVLTPSPSGTVAGASVTLTVAITPATAAGSVTFYDGVAVLSSAVVSGGQAILSTPLLAPGQHSLSARFVAGPGFASSLAPAVSFRVAPVASVGLTAPSQQALTRAPQAVASGDFNHDGIQDFIYGTGGNGVTTLLGNGAGAFTAVSTNAFDGKPMLAADFTGDGIVDLMSILSGSPVLSVGTGSGNFTPSFANGAAITDPGAAAAIADVNRDGWVDLIMTNPNGSVDVALGRGDGTFQAPLHFPLSAAASAVMAADVNGDGIPDIVTVSSSSATSGVLTVAIGDGSGGFTTQPTAIAGGPVSVVAADFNGDHHLDVAVAHSPGNSISVLAGNGNGTFGPPTTIPLGATPVQMLTDDINGDGNADLIVMFATGTPAFAVLYGKGDGSFQSPVTFNDAGTPIAIATADENQDGRRDVVLATSAPSFDVFYGAAAALSVNQGAGQSAAIGTAFAQTLTVNAPSGTTVVFSSPASGPGGTFSGTATATVVADTLGVAAAPAFAAGNIAGDYNVTVSAPGFAVSTSIPLTNTSGPPALISSVFSNVSTATVNTAYSPALQFLVQDAHNNPVPNTPVNLNAATVASGASLTFTGSGTNTATVNTNASGIAVAPATANSIGGSYFVTATATATSVSTQYLTQNIAQPQFLIEISPSGPAVIVDGVSYNGQFNYFDWTPGDTHTLSVSSPQPLSPGIQNAFAGWSDGGSPTHTITVPAGAASLVASFKQQFLLTVRASAGGTVSPLTGYYDPGPVVITATANPGYAFSGWGIGNLSGNVSQQTLNLTGLALATANFTPTSPVLAATLTRAAAFVLGENGATYSIGVKNSAGPSTAGTVTVTEHLPTGLTLVSMSGTGWACAGTVCSQSQVLPPGFGYNPITVTVNVAANAPSPITNQITVSGGGSSPATASDTTTPGAAQSISFGAIASVTFGVAPFTVNATATSGLAVSFSSGTPTVCTLAGTTVTIVAGGVCSLIANQSGNGTYGAATPVTQSFLVNPIAQTVTFALPASPPVNFNLGVPLTATTSSGLQVLYSTTTPLVCYLNVPDVYFRATGACTITAYEPGSPTYLPTSVTVTTIVGNPQVITFSPIADVPAGTTTAALTATSNSGLPVSFASNTPAVCIVSGNTATLVNSGTCSITATQAGNATFGAAPPVVGIFRFVGSATSLTLTSSVNPIKIGGAVTLTATVVPASATGMVTFLDGVKILGISPVSNGQATVATLLMASGTRTLKAVYDDDSIAPATLAEVVTAVPGSGFQPGASYATQLDPFTVAVRDFNGDGIADIAVVDRTGGVGIRLGNGDGTFGAAAIYHVGGYAAGVAVGDFNGDGKPDLAVTSAQDPIGYGTTISILLGNGNGTFQRKTSISSVGSTIGVADFNGDGFADLAVNGNGAFEVFPGNGDGTFGSPINSAPGVGALLFSVADMNGDGKPDIVGFNPDPATPGNVIVLLGKGDGTFNSGGNYSAGSGVSLAVGDFNGDGSPDVAVTAGGPVLVLLNKGDGTLLHPTSYPTSNFGTTAALAIAAADFNGDGKIDLAVTCEITGGFEQSDNVTVFLGNGNGTFQQPAKYNVGKNPNFVALGDFNGDGVTDLVTTNYYDSTISILLGKPTQPATTITLVSSSNPALYGQNVALTATVSPSSATGTVVFYDGVTALATRSLAGGHAILNTSLLASGSRSITATYLGDATHSGSSSAVLTEMVTTLPENGFQTATTFPVNGFPAAIASADFNGDGIPDLVAVCCGNGSANSSVGVFLGQGDGTFQTPASYGVGQAAESVITGDFNGDGFPDLVVGNTGSNSLSLLPGNGDGTFQPAKAIPGYWALTVAAADFNGDGILDLVFGSYPGTGVTVLLGNGDGTFQNLGSYGVGDQPESIAVGDFNGDGKPDVAVATQSSGAAVLLGYGDGTFHTAVNYSTGGQFRSIIAADLDGDGKLDLAVAYALGNVNAGGVAVLHGLGNGTFGSASSTFSAGYIPLALAVGDFNGDGHMDLATGNLAGAAVSVVLGDGSLNFGAPANQNAGNGPQALVAGDFNGDGRTDLAIADGYGSSLTILLGLSTGTPQTISFGALPNLIPGAASLSLGATATSGLAVGFVSSTPSVCTVSGANVTFIGTGPCSITARQPGSMTYAAAPPVTQTFTVNSPFGDVSTADETQTFITAIDDMLSKGITSGCTASPLEYCPTLNVTRGQMAVFIIRSIYGSNNFSYNPNPYFTDATPSAVGSFFPYIQKMHELGITSGCTTTTYCPDLNVTRGQMAVFIIRARYGTTFDFDYPSTPLFTDATTASVGSFFRYIQRMKVDNITSGCTATTYCPDLNVTRDQMAVFMIRGAFNQLLPPTEPIIASASPATGGLGEIINVTLTGVNTHFAQGLSTVSAGAGLTVGTVTVNSLTSLAVQLTIAANATPNPVSLLVSTPTATGTEEAVLPNGFTITSDPAAGLIAYWTGNNTTADTVSSLSGTLMNGATYASATSRTQGFPDAQAFSLNGTNSYVQAATGETGTVSGARTVAAWVYLNSFTGLGEPILTGGSDIFGVTGTAGTCGGGQYQLYVDHAGTCYVSDNSLAPGVWSFVAMTFDGSKVAFYIDGVASVALPAQMSNYGLATLEIGGNTLGGTSSGASFNGLLSEIQIYSRALSPAEIQGLYAP